MKSYIALKIIGIMQTNEIIRLTCPNITHVYICIFYKHNLNNCEFIKPQNFISRGGILHYCDLLLILY